VCAGLQDGVNIRIPGAKAQLPIRRVRHHDGLHPGPHGGIIGERLEWPFVSDVHDVDHASPIRCRWKQAHLHAPPLVTSHLAGHQRTDRQTTTHGSSSHGTKLRFWVSSLNLSIYFQPARHTVAIPGASATVASRTYANAQS
jgi:hypothetical protein